MAPAPTRGGPLTSHPVTLPTPAPLGSANHVTFNPKIKTLVYAPLDKQDLAAPRLGFTRTCIPEDTSAAPVAINRQPPVIDLPIAIPIVIPGKSTRRDVHTANNVISSRPAWPWGQLRKWTCCRCGAQTHAEQFRCARIECLHVRCDGMGGAAGQQGTLRSSKQGQTKIVRRRQCWVT